MVAIGETLIYRVLRKYLNQNSMICEYFDDDKFRYFCKEQ